MSSLRSRHIGSIARKKATTSSLRSQPVTLSRFARQTSIREYTNHLHLRVRKSPSARKGGVYPQDGICLGRINSLPPQFSEKKLKNNIIKLFLNSKIISRLRVQITAGGLDGRFLPLTWWPKSLYWNDYGHQTYPPRTF